MELQAINVQPAVSHQTELIFNGRYISYKYRIYKYTNYEIKQI